ncbi:hypothetical protein ALT_0004 [Aspergillus lentulus]|uniref:Uncharacterized protein n=1 Tax=Aspergillus lentulus TaxID=293939 RepID=A0AAN4PAP6_ASPLE|nr:hypothetical protein ALT_0004 [Aspergillus lentulus]
MAAASSSLVDYGGYNDEVIQNIENQSTNSMVPPPTNQFFESFDEAMNFVNTHTKNVVSQSGGSAALYLPANLSTPKPPTASTEMMPPRQESAAYAFEDPITFAQVLACGRDRSPSDLFLDYENARRELVDKAFDDTGRLWQTVVPAIY